MQTLEASSEFLIHTLKRRRRVKVLPVDREQQRALEEYQREPALRELQPALQAKRTQITSTLSPFKTDMRILTVSNMVNNISMDSCFSKEPILSAKSQITSWVAFLGQEFIRIRDMDSLLTCRAIHNK